MAVDLSDSLLTLGRCSGVDRTTLGMEEVVSGTMEATAGPLADSDTAGDSNRGTIGGASADTWALGVGGEKGMEGAKWDLEDSDFCTGVTLFTKVPGCIGQGNLGITDVGEGSDTLGLTVAETGDGGRV